MLKTKFFMAEVIGDEIQPFTLKEVAKEEVPENIQSSDPEKWWGRGTTWVCYEPAVNGGRVQRSVQWKSQTVLGEEFEHKVFMGIAIPEEADWDSVTSDRIRNVMHSELSVPWNKMTPQNQRRAHGMAMAYWADRD